MPWQDELGIFFEANRAIKRSASGKHFEPWSAWLLYAKAFLPWMRWR